MIQLTNKALINQQRQTAQLIVRYKHAADALPSSGFGLSAKVLSAILLMRGYEAFMYSKRNPYPKTIALLRWQISYLECTRTAYASTASKPTSKLGGYTREDGIRANDHFFQDLYKSLWTHFDNQSFRRFVKRVSPRLKMVAGGDLHGWRCLDVGCGSGAFTIAAAQLGAHCTGIDPAKSNISFARKTALRFGAKNVAFNIGNANRLEFMTGTFDLVICQGVLHHLENPEQALREMHRVLKRDGYLYIGEDGAGGLYNTLWDSVLHIFAAASIKETGRILKVFDVSQNSYINFMDGFFLHYERRSLRSLRSLLRSAGFPRATLLKGSAQHDISALDFTDDPYFVDKFGAGNLRMRAERG